MIPIEGFTGRRLYKLENLRSDYYRGYIVAAPGRYGSVHQRQRRMFLVEIKMLLNLIS